MGRRHPVLVVDDQQCTLTLLSAILKLQGFDVTTVASGQEAVRRLINDTFGLIITDIQLPDVFGPEVLIKVRNSGRSAPPRVSECRHISQKKLRRERAQPGWWSF